MLSSATTTSVELRGPRNPQRPPNAKAGATRTSRSSKFQATACEQEPSKQQSKLNRKLPTKGTDNKKQQEKKKKKEEEEEEAEEEKEKTQGSMITTISQRANSDTQLLHEWDDAVHDGGCWAQTAETKVWASLPHPP